MFVRNPYDKQRFTSAIFCDATKGFLSVFALFSVAEFSLLLPAIAFDQRPISDERSIICKILAERKIKMMLLLIAGAFVAGGCATHREIKGPNNGVPAYYIKCGAAVRCPEEAAEVCPSGYYVLNSDGSHPIGAISNNGIDITSC